MDTLELCSQHIVDGGISYVCMDWRHSPDLLAAARKSMAN